MATAEEWSKAYARQADADFNTSNSLNRYPPIALMADRSRLVISSNSFKWQSKSW